VRFLSVLLIGLSVAMIPLTFAQDAAGEGDEKIHLPWRYLFCARNSWRIYEMPDIERLGLEVVRERIQSAALGVVRDTERTIEVVVTNCPVHKAQEIGIEVLPEQIPSPGFKEAAKKRWFRLYFTAVFLEDMVIEDFLHLAVSYACTIRTGVLDHRLTEWTDEIDVEIMRCRISTAEKSGEPEVARWLRRYLKDG
jgi:hypothetical protein